MKIKWKNHPTFSDYKISNTGRVRRLSKILKYSDGRIENKEEKELKQNISNGYYTVVLFDGCVKLNKSVHRLVAECFLERKEFHTQVNHKDEDKLNNIYTNLEWCTSKENCNYGSRNTKISEKQKGELNHYYKYIEHYEIKPTLRCHFKDVLKRKNLNFEDFEEEFHSYTKNRKVNRKKYTYKRRVKDGD